MVRIQTTYIEPISEIWAYLIYFIGAKLFPEPNTKADHGQLLRTIGFSSAPGLIRVFGFTPDLMSITFIGAGLWMLVAMVIAVRQALDYQGPFRITFLSFNIITFEGVTGATLRSIVVVITGFVIQAVVLVMLLRIFTPS